MKHWWMVFYSPSSQIFPMPKFFHIMVIANIKPTSTTTLYPLGYKYNWEMMHNGVKLPTECLQRHLPKMKVEFSKQWILSMWITGTCKGWFAYLKYHISQQSRKCQNSSIKACEGMKHAMMRNGECTSKVYSYTLHEGANKMYYLHYQLPDSWD